MPANQNLLFSVNLADNTATATATACDHSDAIKAQSVKRKKEYHLLNVHYVLATTQPTIKAAKYTKRL